MYLTFLLCVAYSKISNASISYLYVQKLIHTLIFCSQIAISLTGMTVTIFLAFVKSSCLNNAHDPMTLNSVQHEILPFRLTCTENTIGG